MAEPVLPTMQRQPPKPLIIFTTVIYYLVFVPIDWILKSVFHRPGIVIVMSRRMKKMEAKLKQAFAGYTPTEHDVLVCNFSKSGTNWLMQMAYQIAFLGEGEFSNIHDVVPWPDFPTPNAKRLMLPLTNIVVQEKSPVHMRVIKTHLAANTVPYNDKARYITVIRDPKDIFVSSYFFMTGFYGRVMPIRENWLKSYLSENFPISFGVTWAQHVASYWAWRDRPNVLILSFKDMKKDLPGTVRRVAEFMAVDLTPAQFDRVVEKSSFEYMKAIDDHFLPFARNAFPWMTTSMIRSGKEGNSKELITLEEQQRIDAYFMNQLKELGSDFPYAEFCRIA